MRKNSAARVLVVEDVRMEAALLLRVLADSGYSNVFHCVDVDAALRDVDLNSPRVVIADFGLGERSGIDLTKEIRARSSDHYTYVIMLTSSAIEDRARAAFDAGVDDFVTKPYRPDDLLGRIRVGERITRLETSLRVRSQELETALRRIDVAAAQRALARAAEVIVAPPSGGPPLETLAAAPTWQDAESLMASTLTEFFQIPFESVPHHEFKAAPFTAHILLSDPSKQLELSMSVAADDESLRSLAAHLLGEGDDREGAEALLLEVANILMGALKLGFGRAGFNFTGGIPAAAPFDERRAAFGASTTRARLALGSIHGDVELWLHVREKENHRVTGRLLSEGMVLTSDARDAGGTLLLRGGTRLTRMAAERIARLVPDQEFEVSSAVA